MEVEVAATCAGASRKSIESHWRNVVRALDLSRSQYMSTGLRQEFSEPGAEVYGGSASSAEDTNISSEDVRLAALEVCVGGQLMH